MEGGGGRGWGGSRGGGGAGVCRLGPLRGPVRPFAHLHPIPPIHATPQIPPDLTHHSPCSPFKAGTPASSAASASSDVAPDGRSRPTSPRPASSRALANRSTFTCMLAWLGGVGGQQSGCRSDQFTAAHSLAALCQRRRPRGGRRPRSPATPPGRPSCPSPSACAERGGVGPGRGLRGRRPHSLLHRLPGRTTQLLEQTRSRRPGRGGPTSAQCPAQTGRAGPGWRRPSKTRRPTRGQTRSGKGEERRGIRRCDGVEGGKRAPRRGGRARNGGGRPVLRWQPTPPLASLSTSG